ncbi:MAG: hypothetical protein AAFU64_02785 [Bacteroidota bacterium]
MLAIRIKITKIICLIGTLIFIISQGKAQAPPVLIIPEYQALTESNPSYMPARIFPLGWSKKGAFAYAMEWPDEAGPAYTMNVFVLDRQVEDQSPLFSYKVESGIEGNEKQPNDRESVWRVFGDSIRALLEPFEIIESREIKVKSLASYEKATGNSYKLRILNRKDQASSFAQEHIQELEILPLGKGKAQGFLYAERYEFIDEPAYPIQAFLRYYLAHPYSDKILMILERVYQGKKGSSKPVSFEFVEAWE